VSELSVLLLSFDGTPADPEAVGGVVRLDHESGRYWIITMNAGAVTWSRVLECLAVLVLDEARGVLPHVLFPYNPPQATLFADGRLLDWSGAELPRVRMAIIRRLRYLLRHRFLEYVDKLHRGFSRDLTPDEIQPLDVGHPLFTPHGTLLSADAVPADLLNLRF
jgi:hypothetical protein